MELKLNVNRSDPVTAEASAMIDREQKAKKQPTFALEPWDWAYYTEKVRKAQYDFDENQLKPYLELNNVIEKGVFGFVEQFQGQPRSFGVEFRVKY